MYLPGRRGGKQALGCRDQLVQLNGLIEVLVYAKRLGKHLVSPTLVPCDHYHKRLAAPGLFGLDLFQNEKAASAGEHHVENHQIGLVGLGELEASPLAKEAT